MPKVTISISGSAPKAYRFSNEREQPIRIGRSSSNDIIIDCPSISHQHAEIKRTGGDYVLSDLGSTNGIKHNGNRAKVVWLPAAGIIALGHAQLDFELPEEVSAGVAGRASAPSADANEREHPVPKPARKKRTRHEGIGRLGFVGAFVVIAFLATILRDFLGPLSSVFMGALTIPAAYSRFDNIGRNPKWAFLCLIPILGLLVTVACVLLPAGYADEKKLDLPAKIMLGVIGALVIAALANVAGHLSF